MTLHDLREMAEELGHSTITHDLMDVWDHAVTIAAEDGGEASRALCYEIMMMRMEG